MHINAMQRKSILIHFRLLECYLTKQLLNGYEISKNHEGPDSAFRRNLPSQCGVYEIFALPTMALKECWTVSSKIRESQHEKYEKLDSAIVEWFGLVGITDPVTSTKSKLSVIEFAKLIGIDDSQKAKYIIDRQIAKDLPTYHSITSNKTLSKKLARKYCGIYYLYRLDNSIKEITNNETQYMSRSVLSVRYPVSYGAFDNLSDQLWRVRVKLKMPNSRKTHDTSDYQYDGYMAQKGKWNQWLLQLRRDELNENLDVLLFYSDSMTPKQLESKAALGTMLTQSQTPTMEPSVYPICLFRVSKDTVMEKSISDWPIHADRTGVKEKQLVSSNYFCFSKDLEDDYMSDGPQIIELKKNTESDLLHIDRKAFSLLKGLQTKY